MLLAIPSTNARSGCTYEYRYMGCGTLTPYDDDTARSYVWPQFNESVYAILWTATPTSRWRRLSTGHVLDRGNKFLAYLSPGAQDDNTAL